MAAAARYLQFAILDIQQPDIYAQCSACGKEFRSEVKPGEHVDDVLVRIRDEYNEHVCRSHKFSESHWLVCSDTDVLRSRYERSGEVEADQLSPVRHSR